MGSWRRRDPFSLSGSSIRRLPAKVLALVSDMTGRCGVEFSSHFAGEFVAGIGVKPAPDVEPLGGFAAIPAILVLTPVTLRLTRRPLTRPGSTPGGRC
jgi:hypothetical protein